MLNKLSLAALMLLVAPGVALAHLDPVEHGSFAAGFTHPLFGLDHLLAMVGVGLWAAFIGGRAMWMVPAGFVAAMGVGFTLVPAGIVLPMVEPLILASVVFIGLLVALAIRLPAAAGAGLVGFLALFHGHAHGEEMGAAVMLAYGAGFVLATALLHGAGIALVFGLRRLAGGPASPTLLRAAGGAAAAAGIMLMAG